MTTRIIIWLVVCPLFSIGVVVLLFRLSAQLKNREGSFLREFPPHPIVESDTFVSKHPSVYIAGGSTNKLYVGNYRSPLRLLVVDLNTADTQNIILHIPGIFEQKFWSARILIDSPNFYLYDGAVPVIYEGNINNWTGEKSWTDIAYFQDLVSMGNGVFGVRSLSASTGENILGKITEWEPHNTFTDKILQKQIDGVFCTNGILRYDHESGRLIYVYYYRNQFMVMDSGLNLLRRVNTIDTNSIAKIKVATVNGGWKTLSSPPNFINTLADVKGAWLLIQSNVIARNEYEDASKSGAVIDVYNTVTQSYAFSFYLYNFDRHLRLSEFRVFGDRLIARFENKFVQYRLKPEYFPRFELGNAP